MGSLVDAAATAATRSRYNRIAPAYDRRQALVERVFKPLRQNLWTRARRNTLEVGVGTGTNFPYYPDGVRVTAIDLADQMLAAARKSAQELKLQVNLREGDVQALDFPDHSFDTVVGTFVFCSVPDPIRGLQEVKRVCRPNGQILLLEHVRIDLPVIGQLMDLINPIFVRMMGSNINRQTIANIKRAGLVIEHIEEYGPMRMIKLIVARPPAQPDE